MSGRAALSSEASLRCLLVLDGEASHEVFDVLGVSATSSGSARRSCSRSARSSACGSSSTARSRRPRRGPRSPGPRRCADHRARDLRSLGTWPEPGPEPRRNRARTAAERLMLVGDLDDVTYDSSRWRGGRRTLHRKVWERGGWATVAIAYEERGAEGVWKPAKLALIRLQRSAMPGRSTRRSRCAAATPCSSPTRSTSGPRRSRRSGIRSRRVTPGARGQTDVDVDVS